MSSDFRDVEKAMQEGNERAKLARQIFVRRVADYIGRYFVQMGGCDAIAFTAGIGENSFSGRHDILEAIKEALGIQINEDINHEAIGEEALISTPESKIKVFVIPTDEELVIARDTKRLLNL